MRKILATVASAGLLVGAAFTASVINDNGIATAQESTDTTTAADTPRGTFFQDVFDQLVTDGVISQAQADAVQQALTDAMADHRPDGLWGPGPHGHFDGPGGFHGGPGGFLGGLLDDGVIDADELAALPEGNPLTDPDGPYAAYLDDGQLTQEEITAVHDALEAQREADRAQIESFLEDGVISSEELAQLPDDSPLKNSDAAADGEITQDELDAMRPGRGGHHGPGGFGRGFGPGFGLDDDATAQGTSA